MGEKQCMEKERAKKEERKSVLTMASYACEHHHGWGIQTTWTNNTANSLSHSAIDYEIFYKGLKGGGDFIEILIFLFLLPEASFEYLILQGLQVAQAAVTERWP